MVIESGSRAVATRRSGAPADFRTFFSTNHERMVRSLCLALGDDQLGRDAASEGFARALVRWSRVSAMRNPPGWVYRVGLNWGRSRRRRTRREFSVERIEELPGDAAPDLAGSLSLRRALDGLSDDHRDVIVARYYLDWSEAHIADALGIRPGTVKSRLSRALHQLELALAEPPTEDGSDGRAPSERCAARSTERVDGATGSITAPVGAAEWHPSTPDTNGAP